MDGQGKNRKICTVGRKRHRLFSKDSRRNAEAFLEAAEKMNVKEVIKSETANILTTEHKVVMLSEFDLEDILYVDDEGNIKERQ